MKSENSILKIYVSNTDNFGMSLFYEHLVMKAYKKGISGATAYRGITGYGLSSNKIVSGKFWEINEKLPVIIEMIDRTEVLENFIEDIKSEIEEFGKGCLVYMQPIDIIIQQSGKKK
ncbi:MAG: hypothetical protein H6Q19_1828 [Bacteroidetes bacterium]|nr:hypothetical protein [Bacteroidota bacterium]